MMKRAGLLIFMMACATDTKTTEPRDPRDSAMPTITLTASAPRHEQAISAVGTNPTTLTITIATIDNPAGQAFSVGAGVTWIGADARAIDGEIGSIAPFPATQPGRFVLSVPDTTRELMGRSDGRLSLRLSLVPVASDRALVEPLKVTVGDLVWR